MAALALLVVAACAAWDSLQELDADIEDAGLEDVTTTLQATDGSVVVVSASAPRGQTAQEAQDEVAEVVWTTFPHRFDRLRVSVDGEDESWSYADLERRLGDRPASLDVGDDIGDELGRSTVIAVLAILAAGVLGLAVIGLVLFLALRASRRHAPAPRPIRPWMPPGMPTGPAPPPGGWAPAPPPGGWAPASAPPAPPGRPGQPGPSPEAPPPAPVALAKGPPPPPATPRGRRPRDPDARRLGRRPRGPVPDEAHTPPGWG